MRLSDIKGERVFDVIADLIPPIANIAQDAAVSALFRQQTVKGTGPDGKITAGDVYRATAERIAKNIPALIKDHRGDMVTILATIKGVPEEDYKESLTMATLVYDVTELLNDDEFTQLFFSSAGQGQKDSGGSGSASESTGAPEA